MLTGDADGNYYKGGIELKSIADKAGIDLLVKESDGSYQNVMSVGKNQADLGISQMDVLVYFTYIDDEHKKASDNCLAIAPTELEYIHILVNNKAGITSLEDIKDKKVAAGAGKSGTGFTFGFMTAYLYGMKADNPNFQTMEEEDGIKKVVEGEMDVAIYVTTLNSELFTSIPEDADVRLLSFTKGEISDKARNVYSVKKIPAGTYPWLKEDVEVPVTPSFLIASKDAKPESIEKLVKSLYENEENLDDKTHLWTENASEAYEKLKALKIPFHPVVDKYFEGKKK
ncbi:MAG: TAXI family TRAP transporter solute-binding subunit [Leptospiraceae bacterium]|nr:TAXI family TRAP transporter solute-binding subunit [Leptospiraceae bacterium]